MRELKDLRKLFPKSRYWAEVFVIKEGRTQNYASIMSVFRIWIPYDYRNVVVSWDRKTHRYILENALAYQILIFLTSIIQPHGNVRTIRGRVDLYESRVLSRYFDRTSE